MGKQVRLVPHKLPLPRTKLKKLKKLNLTDRPTDQPTNRPTDKPSYRAAQWQLKIIVIVMFYDFQYPFDMI